MKKFLFGLLGLPIAAYSAYLDVATDKDPIAYAVGETAELTFSVSSGTVYDYEWAWAVAGDDGFRKEGAGNVVSVSCAKPGFVRVDMSATPVGGGTKISYTASVGFGVDQIQPDGQRPEDLKSFWDNRLKAIQDAIDPTKVEMVEAGTVNNCTIYKVRLGDLPDGLGPCTGWLTVPNDTSKKYPADALFYGYENSWSSDNRAKPTTADRTKIQFRVMAHAFELEQDAAYYDSFKAGTESRGKTHGLDPVQNANPLTSYFNGMACRDIRAMLFLKTLEAWDGATLTATGHSQGGLQCIWAGLAPGVTQINPECPWNCNMYGQMEAGRVRDDRLHPAWAPGLAYYDPCFIGRLISPDCVVNLTRAGLADYCCPPSCVAAFYNTLPQEKSIRWLQGSAHSQSSIPTVQHWFDADAEKDETFNAATDYAGTKEFVPVAEEVKWDDGFCGDISELSGLTNRFVSYGGTWGANDQKYKMVQDALAKAKAGDVIWIHDGFVCEPDGPSDYVDGGGSTRTHFKVSKAVTFRSVAGDARNHANPPSFRGRWHDPDAVPVVKQGNNAIRALGVDAAAQFIGLVFENSSTRDNASYPGGCIACSDGKKAMFDKCIVRNNVSTRGAIKSDSAVITDCVFSNNTGTAVGNGASLYNCHFENNTGCAVAHFASRTEPIIVSNCTFVANKGGSGAGVSGQSGSTYVNYWKVMDCVFSNNTATTGGGAIYGRAVISNCTFVGNEAQGNGGGGAVQGVNSTHTKIYNCKFLGNRTKTASGNGGAVVSAAVYGSALKDNLAEGCGGGAASCVLDCCQIVDNVSTNPPGYTSSSGGLGGGLYLGSATNCVISGNKIWHNSYYCARGGGAYSTKLFNCTVANNWAFKWGGGYSGPGWCYNTLFTGNTAGNQAGAIDGRNSNTGYDEIHLINCTVAGNGAASGNGGVHNVHAVNTISWGNGPDKDSFYSATNCCSKVLTDTTKYPGCIAADPVFTNNGFSDYELSEDDSPCVDAAQIFTWMLEPTDLRSMAPNGVARVVGAKPDIGCFEVLKKVVPTTCTVTFDLGEHGTRTGGGELIQLVTYGEPAVSPEVKPEVLWAFDGWDADITSITSDLTVNAVYSAVDPETVQHTVTFDLGTHGERTGGGELVQTVTHYHAAVEPEFTQHEGWEFQNWDKDISSIVGDTDVKAVWKRVENLPTEGEGEEDAPIKVETLTALTNRFVSSTGDWGGNSQRYTDLEDAMKAAYAGDVIWLRNGFVERPASEKDYIDGGSSTRTHFKFTKAVTVRSLTGDARVDPNPPRIRGRWHAPDADPVVKAGANAIRALQIEAAATFEGIVFEDSSTLSNSSYPGGCLVGGGKAKIRKCVIRNNVSHRGTVSSKAFKFYDCVFSNNTGTAVAGSDVYNCLFANNTGCACALFDTLETPIVISNCTFVGNTGSSGAAISGSTGNYHNYWAVYDCLFSNNVASANGGAFYGMGTVSNCTFVGNSADKGGGGAVYGQSTLKTKVFDSVFLGNMTKHGDSGGAGGAVYAACLSGCTIVGNMAQGNGGGASACHLSNCTVADNISTNTPGATGSNGGLGGGVSGGSATNCVIAGNRIWHNNYYCARGGGAYSTTLINCVVSNNWAQKWGGGYSGPGTCYNTLFTGNTAGNQAGGVDGRNSNTGYDEIRLINCTVAGNGAASGFGGLNKVHAVNTISWGNGPDKDVFSSATNSCAAVLADAEKYPGCITDDPRFNADGSWTLRLRSPCKDTAMPFGWMTDAADPRSKDIGGNDRVIGAGPDMGCYERPPKIGFTILVR